MRQSFNAQFLYDNDKFVGVSLGSDHCSEHEWGIKGIQRFFGLADKEKAIGMERYATLNPRDVDSDIRPNVLKFYDGSSYFGFYCINAPWDGTEPADPPKWGNHIKPQFYGDKDIYAGWNEGAFCFFQKKSDDSQANRRNKKNLKSLYMALCKGEATVWVGGAGPFSSGGLCFAIKDRLPEGTVEKWESIHTEEKRMDDYLTATGIHDKIRESGKDFFYCAPKRIYDGNVRFWLNPTRQNEYNSGWYTLAELKQWCQDKGPVIKT